MVTQDAPVNLLAYDAEAEVQQKCSAMNANLVLKSNFGICSQWPIRLPVPTMYR